MSMRRDGFTLVQVILVLAVLSTVTALAVPNYTSRLQESKVKADIVQMDTLLSDFQLNQVVTDYAYSMVTTDNADLSAQEILQAYVDALFDSGSQVYMAELYSPDTEETLVLEAGDWVPVYRSESDSEYLWLSNRTTGTESDARVKIPDRRVIDDKYTEGENITWGDTLLLVGDRENLETRFYGPTCDNYVMESEFYYDNHVHQDKDHKGYYGLVFNYVDDENFFMIALRLKNGSKTYSIYEVKEGIWEELIKNLKLPNGFNPPGNVDYPNRVDFQTRIQVDNENEGIADEDPGSSNVTFWIKRRTDSSYFKVFQMTFEVERLQQSQRYGFYIGDPISGSKLDDGAEIEYITDHPGMVESYEYGNEDTYMNPEIQIQLAYYPSMECVDDETQLTDPPDPPNPLDPFSLSVTLTNSTSKGWEMTLASEEDYSYSIKAYDDDKNNLEASDSATHTRGTSSINLGKKSDRYELIVTDSEGNVYERNESLSEQSFTLP